MLVRVNNIDEFRQLLHVIVLCAPDRFPTRDFLKAEDQLTLNTAYRDMNYGMQFVAKKIRNTDTLAKIQSMLDQSLEFYLQGEKVKGAHLLQDLEDLIYGKPSYRP